MTESLDGKWDAWRRTGPGDARWIWALAETELRTTIQKHGHVNIYVYFGQERDRNIEHVLRMDDLRVSKVPISPPGPACESNTKCKIWLRYQDEDAHGVFKTKIKREEFKALPVIDNKISTIPQVISENDWSQMHFTGLIFVVDPRP